MHVSVTRSHSDKEAETPDRRRHIKKFQKEEKFVTLTIIANHPTAMRTQAYRAWMAQKLYTGTPDKENRYSNISHTIVSYKVFWRLTD